MQVELSYQMEHNVENYERAEECRAHISAVRVHFSQVPCTHCK